MAPLINLLPNHRAESRKARARRFGVFVAIAVGAAAALIGCAHLVTGARVSVQDDRNSYLKTEIASLDRQISEIKELKSKTQEMLARKRAVESLQASRSQAVALLNQIAKVPEGVYYSTVRQNGDDISLTGYAQSNFHVASLMRSIETSGVFTQPKLLEVHQAPDPQDSNNRVVQFSINCKMTNVALLQAARSGMVNIPGMPQGAMIMGPNGQLMPAQSLLMNGARSSSYIGANGAPTTAVQQNHGQTSQMPANAAPGVPGLPGVPAVLDKNGQAVPAQETLRHGARSEEYLGAGGAPAPAQPPRPAAPLPSSVTGGILGAPAHQALNAARMGAAIAARPSGAMQAAESQAK